MNKALIAPSMMCVPAWRGTEETLNALERGGVDLLHLDVMDGQFVPNMMLGTEHVRQLREASDIPLDIHLMIERPEDKLDWFEIAEGEWVSIHAESTNHLQRVLSRVRDRGAHPMVALNPATPICMIENVLEDVDGVLLMTVNPGFAGQKLVKSTLQKLALLREMLNQLGMTSMRIEVDGNVSPVNGAAMRKFGADMFVCGSSSVFSKEASIEENIERFRWMIEHAVD